MRRMAVRLMVNARDILEYRLKKQAEKPDKTVEDCKMKYHPNYNAPPTYARPPAPPAPPPAPRIYSHPCKNPGWEELMIPGRTPAMQTVTFKNSWIDQQQIKAATAKRDQDAHLRNLIQAISAQTTAITRLAESNEALVKALSNDADVNWMNR